MIKSSLSEDTGLGLRKRKLNILNLILISGISSIKTEIWSEDFTQSQEIPPELQNDYYANGVSLLVDKDLCENQ